MKLQKQSTPRLIPLFFLSVLLLLAGCQKSTQFNYVENGDYFSSAEQVMNDLASFTPSAEKTVILAASFNGNGIGLLQEHQLHDFSSITINTVSGGKIIISVPLNPSELYRWHLIRNESRTSSQSYIPKITAQKADPVEQRINYLIEPEFDTDVTFVLEDDLGNRKMTFQAVIKGTGK